MMVYRWLQLELGGSPGGSAVFVLKFAIKLNSENDTSLDLSSVSENNFLSNSYFHILKITNNQ